MNPLRSLMALFALGVALLLAGCTYWPGQRAHRSSSLVSFLYPAESQPLVTPSTPELALPLRVGVAFVPSAAPEVAGFTALQKQRLLERIAADFRALPFVQAIEVVPESYLRPAGGFANLDQLGGLLGLDVVVLIGYDQVQFTEDNDYAFAYWTIVGAYCVKGSRNDTHTLMEASVYDIRSRALLFRAPGAAQTKDAVALVNVDRRLRADSERGFTDATADLLANLHRELDAFGQRVKEGKADAKVVHRPGYTGAGALDATGAAVLLVTLAAAVAIVRVAERKRSGRARRAGRLGAVLLAASLGVAGMPQVRAQEAQDTAAPTVVGVYDPRVLAVAYAGSPVHERWIAKQRAALAEAKAAGDEARAACIKAEVEAQQRQLHRQAAGKAPVEDLLAQIPAEVVAVRQAQGVVALVSAGDEAALAAHRGQPTVDVTVALVEAFHPTERQRRFVRELLARPAGGN